MKTKNNKKVKRTKKTTLKRPWRVVADKWTDTCLDHRLLVNPSLMTDHELAYALEEFEVWRHGKDKYDFEVDPILEGKENECPFSPEVFTKIITEIICRLKIGGDLSLGRFAHDIGKGKVSCQKKTK